MQMLIKDIFDFIYCQKSLRCTSAQFPELLNDIESLHYTITNGQTFQFKDHAILDEPDTALIISCTIQTGYAPEQIMLDIEKTSTPDLIYEKLPTLTLACTLSEMFNGVADPAGTIIPLLRSPQAYYICCDTATDFHILALAARKQNWRLDHARIQQYANKQYADKLCVAYYDPTTAHVNPKYLLLTSNPKQEAQYEYPAERPNLFIKKYIGLANNRWLRINPAFITESGQINPNIAIILDPKQGWETLKNYIIYCTNLNLPANNRLLSQTLTEPYPCIRWGAADRAFYGTQATYTHSHMTIITPNELLLTETPYQCDTPVLDRNIIKDKTYLATLALKTNPNIINLALISFTDLDKTEPMVNIHTTEDTYPLSAFSTFLLEKTII